MISARRLGLAAAKYLALVCVFQLILPSTSDGLSRQMEVFAALSPASFRNLSSVHLASIFFIPHVGTVRAPSLRGGRDGEHANSSAALKQSRPAGRIAEKLKKKLESIVRKKTIMSKYDAKWGGKASEEVKCDLLPQPAISKKRSRAEADTAPDKDQLAAYDVGINQTQQYIPRNPDAILKHLNRTGLCTADQLDARVKTYMVSMRKSGGMKALKRALHEFAEYLVQPKSHRKQVRNKSAVLTQMLLDAQLDARNPQAKASKRSHNSKADDDPACRNPNLSWSSALRWGVAVSDEGSTATALCNSTYMEAYPTVVTEQVFRSDRDYEVRIRVESMARMMFVGVMSKRKQLGDAHNTSEWWGRYNMTDLVWYAVSNGRLLNGAMRATYTSGGFAAGDELVLRLLLTKRRVEYELAGQSLGFVSDVEGRVRVAVQFKNADDRVQLLHRRTLSDLVDAGSPHDVNVTAPPSPRNAREPADPRYVPPFGGRKVFVGGTKDLDSDAVEEHFKRFGPVATVGLVRRIDGKSRGFGFVTFQDRRDAKRAVTKGVTTRKHGSDFARMQILESSAPVRGDLALDLRTAEVLRELDLRKRAEATNKKLAQAEALRPEEAKAAEDKVELTKAVALDCEMVGVGPRGRDSILAKVSIVNEKLQLLYSRLVLPTEQVTDYRSAITGLSEGELTAQNGALPFDQVQSEVAALVRGRILVGHALHNDFRVLDYHHPWNSIRDTARYRVLREPGQTGQPSLKKLAMRVLGVDMQTGVHSAAEDAATCMRIYALYKTGWERSFVASQKKLTERTRKTLRKSR